MKSKTPKKGFRFNVYFPKEDYRRLKQLSSQYGFSHSRTIREALQILEVSWKSKVSQEALAIMIGFYQDLIREISSGKHIVIEDPKKGEKIRIIFPRIEIGRK